MFKRVSNTLVFLAAVWFFCSGSAFIPADTTPPQVWFTSPAGNANLSGIVNIQVQASDNKAVSKVEVYINNLLKATGYATSCNYTWDTGAGANGSYIIKAIAYDSSKNTKTAQISVTVNNVAPAQPGTPGEEIKAAAAYVSSYASSNKSAAYAIDNKLSTYWQGLYRALFSSKTITSWWIRFDLDKPYDLAKISIWWDKTYGAANYSIQGSNDYISWANLSVNQASTGGTANPYQKDHLVSGTYKYIRVNINKAQLKYPIIYEAKLYRKASSDTQGPAITIISPKEGEVVK